MEGSGRKYTQLQVQERILFLMSIRSKGVKGNKDLFRIFSEKYPDLSYRQFEYDLKKVKDEISEYFEKDRDFEISETVKHLWELYSKSFKLQDYRECRNVLKDLANLKGLNEQKIKIETTVKYEGKSDEELEALLKKKLEFSES